MSETNPTPAGSSDPSSRGGSELPSPVAVAEDALRRADRAFDGLTRTLGHGSSPRGELKLLDDVDLDVRIELGRTRMLVEDVLRLGPDSVVELDKAAGDPVDIYVNGRHIARGEVLVVNENFCVRVSEILEPLGGHPGAA
ncbi:MAG: flagellar motor switch protein FliN [Phycisphaerae bacterium]|nr:flagellar motor switch protein FliN [Phycisphaerae bacterium]